ncbi:MAG: FtsH protease activity modulator HflK [Acidobacteriota bacterium]|jgi:membrane protease subunit HflK
MADNPFGGGGRGGQGLNIPPELQRLRKLPFLKILLALVVLVVAFNGFYMIEPEQQGVVLRFGRFTDITDPGLHFKIPMVDQVIKVPTQRQLKDEFGYRTREAGVRTTYSQSDLTDESLMLTGDLNVADVEWVVQYRIRDPEAFLFRVRNPQDTLRDLSEAVMRQTVGDRTVNEVLTIGRQEIATLVQQELQDLLNQYETGLHVEQVVLQNVTPPDPVRPSFNEVNEAEQEREQKINAAQSEYNKVIPKARGEAQQTIQQAEGYALDRVNRAEGEAARFNSLFAQYRLAPEVTRKRLYLETMTRIVPQVGQKVIVDEDARSVLPLLNLGSGPMSIQGQGGGQ